MLLEPIYKIRGDWPRLIGVYEVEARHTVDPEAKIALYKQIAEGYEIGLDDPAHAYEALARALAEDPQNPEVQTSTERLARALRRLDDLVARYGPLVESVADPERKNALYHKIARLAEADLGDDGQAAAAYLAALDVWPRDLEAANALEQLYLRRADYQNLVKLLLRKAEIVEDVAEKKTLYFRAAQLHEEVIEDLGGRRRGVPARAVRRRRRQGRAGSARAAVHPARALERPQERLREEGGAGDHAGREEADAVRPRAGLRPRARRSRSARSRPTARSWTSIPRTTTPRRRSIACTSSSGAGTTCSPCSSGRPSWRRRPPRWCRCAYRIGELWREHLKDLGRAVEAYRQVLATDPAHEPTIRALEALMTGKDEPVLAAAVLEPIYESAGEWDRVIAVYEVMQAHSDDPVRTVELLSRIAEIEERRLSHQNAAFDVYGRALRVDPNNQDVLAHLERLAAETGHWAKLSDAARERDREGRRTAPRDRSAAAPRARLRGGDRPARRGDRHLPARHRAPIPTARQALVALDRLFGRAQQWDELAEVVRREIRIAPSRRGSDRAHLPARADLRAGAGRHAQGCRGLPRDPDRRSDARRDARGAGADVHGRHDAGRDRRRPRAALQAGRGVGEAASDSRGAARSADRRHRAADAAAPPGRDRRAQAGRSGRGVRMVGGGGQGGSVVGAGARRAAAPGARDPPVGRLRHDDDGRHDARSRARRAARRAAAVGRQLRERPRQPGARRGRAGQGAERAPEGPGGAGLAGSHLREPGDVREPGRDPAPAADDHRRQRRAGHPATCGSGACTPRRWRRSTRRSRATWRCSSTSRARADALEALERLYFRSERWPRAVRRLREAGRRHEGRRRAGRLLRAHGQAGGRRARRSREGRRAVGPRRRHPRRGRHRAFGPGRSARDGGRVERADRGAGEAGPRDARSRGAHPDLQAPGPHLGREAVARAQLARELAEGPGDRSAGRRRPARASPRTTRARARGRSCRRRCAA